LIYYDLFSFKALDKLRIRKEHVSDKTQVHTKVFQEIKIQLKGYTGQLAEF